MADLYIPPKPAIVRASELPRTFAEAKGIEALGPLPVFMAAGAMKPSAAPAGPPLDGISGTLTGAVSVGRDLLTSFIGNPRYVIDTGIGELVDQNGGTSYTNISDSAQPTVSTAGPQGRACANFDGSNDALYGPAHSAIMTATDGYMVVVWVVDSISSDNGTTLIHRNQQLIANTSAGGHVGLALRTSGSPGPSVSAFGYTGSYAIASAEISTGAVLVVEWRHEGGNLYVRVNGGSEASVSCGSITLKGTMAFGRSHSGTGGNWYADGKLFEAVTFSTPPSSDDRDALVANMLSYYG